MSDRTPFRQRLVVVIATVSLLCMILPPICSRGVGVGFESGVPVAYIDQVDSLVAKTAYNLGRIPVQCPQPATLAVSFINQFTGEKSAVFVKNDLSIDQNIYLVSFTINLLYSFIFITSSSLFDLKTSLLVYHR